MKTPIEPMEARSAETIPKGDAWLYEPKWDGFRCIAFRNGESVALQSKSGQPLERYFPEIVDALKNVRAKQFVLDGELAIEHDGRLDFDALLQRIHPAASRVKKLAAETPARFYIFDLLADADNDAAYALPLEDRRLLLETFHTTYLNSEDRIKLSPVTRDYEQAEKWLHGGMAWFDGVIAKKAAAAYRFGERDAVVKIKRLYTADCVVGGFRLAKDGKTIASLLLGLYEDELLHLVGFVGSMPADERERAGKLLKGIVEGPGFTGAQPGGESRWGTREAEWHPVAPKIVVEVNFDHVTKRRFRHGARFVRWRPDKDPQQCTMEQLLQPRGGKRSV